MTLLQLVQAACGEMGISRPNAVASSTDPQIIQLYALMNKVGGDIITNENWEGLTKEYRFDTEVISLTGDMTSDSAVITGLSSTTGIAALTFMATGENIPADTYVSSVDSSTQVTLSNPVTDTESGVSITFTQTKYSLPSDFDRMVHRTQWDKTNHWELMGPKSAQEWQYLKGGIVATGPRIRYRILGGYLQIWPPAAESQLGFEYVSNAWVTGSNGTAKTEFSDDADTCIFRDRTMICGAKFEFYNIKGFDTTSLSRDYYMQVQKEMAMDHSAPTLSLSSSNAPMFINSGSIPDSGYGS
ncbi:hypothetical protein [Nitrosovibrio sp. Nv6]|uniref:hypothetical protein n=1 Tax=Nitrosovibrio sp. Nv6 TaxID=1855340 RepID=UPI0008CDC570|nr:hypothetical protein [Nitrosovibrio sp. Nv6]SEO77599.1 hypothetical protein SAMN05216316_1062 [Nitrosovibrio sp. Nv6]